MNKWIIFPVGVSKKTILWHLSRAKGICGYIVGIPGALTLTAEEEGWTFPHIWEEVPCIWEEG